MPFKKIRLQIYADENFPVGSVRFLRSLGISIIHAYSMGNIQKSDLFHLKISKTLNRILITRDRDFYYNWQTLKDHPGVILISPGSQTSYAINQVCKKSFKKLSTKIVKESLIKISANKIIRNKNNILEEIKI